VIAEGNGKMIKYRENRNDIIQRVEIDLTRITVEDRQDIKRRLDEVLNEYDNILEYDGRSNKLIYKTEVLIPKTINSGKLNLLMVLGNPAVHSVAERMFFSYEKTRAEGRWKEHRFWRALRDCGVLRFCEDIEEPTPKNIEKINSYKRDCLLNGKYESDFNIFLLPYFSFPTPSDSGVDGIRKIVGKEIFKEMKKFEFQRFENIVSGNGIKNVICFQKTNAGKEIIQKAEGKQRGNILNYPVYKIDIASKQVTLYSSAPTRRLHTDKGKKILKCIVADIRKKNRIG